MRCADLVKVNLIVYAGRAGQVDVVPLQPAVERGLERLSLLHALDKDIDVGRTPAGDDIAALVRGLHQTAAVENLLSVFLDDLRLVTRRHVQPLHGGEIKLRLFLADRQDKGKARARLTVIHAVRHAGAMRRHIIAKGIGKHIKRAHNAVVRVLIVARVVVLIPRCAARLVIVKGHAGDIRAVAGKHIHRSGIRAHAQRAHQTNQRKQRRPMRLSKHVPSPPSFCPFTLFMGTCFHIRHIITHHLFLCPYLLSIYILFRSIFPEYSGAHQKNPFFRGVKRDKKSTAKQLCRTYSRSTCQSSICSHRLLR